MEDRTYRVLSFPMPGTPTENGSVSDLGMLLEAASRTLAPLRNGVGWDLHSYELVSWQVLDNKLVIKLEQQLN